MPAPPPKPFRDHWILLGIVALAAVSAGVMEYRHSKVRELESWGDSSRGIVYRWSWSTDSDPTFFGTCVKIEYWLWQRGASEQWIARNIERVRRRLRSNFSPVSGVFLHDTSLRILTNDDDFETVIRAVELGRSRGAAELELSVVEFVDVDIDSRGSTYKSPRYPKLSTLAGRSNRAGQRARSLVELTGDMKFD